MEANDSIEKNPKPEMTPQEEIEDMIKERVALLAASGNPERATAVLIEYRRSLLEDSHPSKKPDVTGSIEGDRASQLAKFEEEAKIMEATSALIAAFTFGGMTPDVVQDNAMILLKFIREEHPNLMKEASKYLLVKKTEKGMSGHTPMKELESKIFADNSSREDA